MKKNIRYILIFTCFLFISCTAEESEFSTLNDQVETEYSTEYNNEEQLMENAEIIPYLIHDLENRNIIKLVDLLSNEELYTFALNENIIILDIFNSEGTSVVFAWISSDDEWNVFDNVSDRVKFLIFDDELNLIGEFFITDSELTKNWFTLTSTNDIVFTGDSLSIYYLEDRMWTASSSEQQTLYRYDVFTGETHPLFEITDENLIINALRKIDEDVLFFNANRDGDQLNMYFGFINLETEEKTIHYETFNRGGFVYSGNHILFTEAPDPNRLVPGQISTFILSRSEIIVINTETMIQYTIPLSGLESMWATLSWDGSKIVTINDEFTVFRKIDIITSNVVFEQEVSIYGDVFEKIVALPNGNYELLSFTVIIDTVIDDVEHQEIETFRQIIRMSEVLE